MLIIDRKDLLDGEGKIIWKKLPKNIPFNDFIDFADNEGCLDWEVSKKLYGDFKNHNKKAKEIMGAYWYEQYELWMNTFKVAKNNGVVVFG